MPKNDFQFSLADFFKILKKNNKTVLFWTFIAGAICCWLALSKQVTYQASATFRDKGRTEATIRSSIVNDFLFSTSSGKDSEAASTMKSRQLISQAIAELNGQGFIVEDNSSPWFKEAYDSIRTEWAYWNNYKEPILEDPRPPLVVTDVDFKGELTRHYHLNFLNDHQFTINDEEKMVGEGTLDTPVVFDHVRFTVKGKNPKKGASYTLVLMSMEEVAKGHNAKLFIDLDKDDKTLLKLIFFHRDRHYAAAFINTLMESYQKRLEDEHELISNAQVNYLQRRQKEVGENVAQLMHDFVLKAYDDMSTSGFTSLQKEMDFLSNQLAVNQQKITDINLEIERLQNIDCNSCVHFDRYRDTSDTSTINKLLEEIRLLQIQGDGLQLALHPDVSSSAIEEEFQTLELLRHQLEETEQVITHVQSNNLEPVILQAVQNSPVAEWYKSYRSKQKTTQLAGTTSKSILEEDFEQFKSHFLNYLATFKRLLKIRQAILAHQIPTQELDAEELPGLTLETSQNLFKMYVQEMHDLEAQEKQHRFLVEQMEQPAFEISSVAALLSDAVSAERINKASQLAISLKDEYNRTPKERERLQEELQLQKLFFISHIAQMADLLQLKSKILNSKIAALRLLMLELTQQQLALTKKHFADYIESRINNLSHEKISLKDQQAELQKRMSTIPPKWAEEQLLNQNLALHQNFMENLANMVESKNITKNLEMIQSAPLDLAVSPLHPKPPRILFFTLLGAIFGFIATSCLLFTRTLIKGIPASVDNVGMAAMHVSGFITPFQGDEKSATAPLLNNDLDTLRRLIAHYEITAAKTVELLILSGNGPDFSNTLAKLLSKKGLRVLKLQLNFKTGVEEPGLLQYLEGTLDFPPIEHMNGFDLITSGGTSRYSEELLRSQRFMGLLNSLKPSYDWIIAVTALKVTDAEAENLAKMFTALACVITDETLPKVMAFNSTLDEKHQKALSLLFTSS